MRELVFFLEEESAKALLELIVPRLLPQQNYTVPRFVVFEGKQDLKKQLPRKINGYMNPDAHFIVLHDQDANDCVSLKNNLFDLCPVSRRNHTTIRIACREMEAFYLGDLKAVEAGLEVNGLEPYQNKAKYRNPDQIVSPASDLTKLTEGRYQKVAGSRAIAPHLDLQTPRSRSFFHLIQAIRQAALRA